MELSKPTRHNVPTRDTTSGVPGNKFPRNFEGLEGISDEASDLVLFNLSDTYWNTYMESINNITSDMATQAAINHIHPESFLIVVVGDRSIIEKDILDLNLGNIYYLDEHGN